MTSLANGGVDTTLVNSFNGFLEHEFDNGRYNDKVNKMLTNGEIRLMINLNDFRLFDPILAQRFIKNPSLHIPSFTKALTDYANKTQPQVKERTNTEYFFGFEGSLGSHHVSPRELTTDLLRCLVCVEGIVVKCSTIKPKVVESVHYCEKTGEERRQVYKDETSAVSEAASSFYPTRDAQGNPYSTEFGLSRYRDFQTIVIQEMPERAPPGQLPRSVEVILHDDLVDRAKPGDRLRVYGIYRALPKTNAGQKHTKAVFRTALLANCVKMLNKEIHGPVLTEEDIQNIKKIAAKKDVFSLMAKSLAPSIYGHEYMKKAVLLQLLGGVEKNLENGTHIRGDINVLMVGDPSTAKSQLLRFVLNTAPLAISTTGRGASGVGLTAAVTSDSETGEKRLEAGAMVLADRGIVCIDEFDKMSTEDRVAIHEVMEQQTVTIAKAGIHTTLNARCSVLAAANPVYGKYDRRKKPWENIGLPDSLLSRFDLLFIVLDKSEPEHDRMIAEHVLRMHRYKQIDENANSHLPNVVDEEDDKESLKTPVYQKHDRLLHGDRKKGEKLLSIPFIKKFLLYAKTRIKPVLDEESQHRIIDAFADLRSREDIKTLPITARTLETMIRLSVAHAKSRLSNSVSLDDAEEALKIMRYAMYHDASPDVADNKKAQSEPAAGTEPEPEAESVQEMDVAEDDNSVRPDEASQVEDVPDTTRTRRKRKASEMTEDDGSESQRSAKRAKTTRTDSAPRENIFGNNKTQEKGQDRYQRFQKLVIEAFQKQHGSNSMTIEELSSFIKSRSKDNPFSEDEIQSLLEKMDQDKTIDKIVFVDGVINLL